MSDLLDVSRPRPASDHDAILLEGLIQLILAGETAGSEFEKIESEVYSRLRDAYSA